MHVPFSLSLSPDEFDGEMCVCISQMQQTVKKMMKKNRLLKNKGNRKKNVVTCGFDIQ